MDTGCRTLRDPNGIWISPTTSFGKGSIPFGSTCAAASVGGGENIFPESLFSFGKTPYICSVFRGTTPETLADTGSIGDTSAAIRLFSGSHPPTRWLGFSLLLPRSRAQVRESRSILFMEGWLFHHRKVVFPSGRQIAGFLSLENFFRKHLTRIGIFRIFAAKFKNRQTMCMYATQKEPFVAETDITCYKVISKNIFGIYRTPLRGTWIKRNQIKGRKPMIASGYHNGTTIIEGGFIHGFDNLLCCERWFWHAKKHIEHGLWEFEIHGCIIPAGTEYYSDGSGSIAAKQVFIGKRVKSKYE